MDVADVEIQEEYMPAELVDLYGDSVYKLCRKLTFSKEDADELFQDAFLEALEKGICSENRLFTTVLFLWKSKKRKFARRNRIAPTVPLESSYAVLKTESAEESIIRRETLMAVHELVDTLQEKYRVPVILFYTLEISIAEIAAAMDIPEGTVKSRLHKARGEIKKGLVKLGYDL